MDHLLLRYALSGYRCFAPESKLVLLAHHFGVSRATALYRLKNLRLIKQQEFEDLRAAEEKHGQKVATALDLPSLDHAEARAAFRRRFLGLALEALRRGAITRSKLEELGAMQGVAKDEVSRLLAETGLDVAEPADVAIPDGG